MPRRWLKAVGVIVACAALLAAAINALSPSSGGPASSSYATSAAGMAGYAELLTNSGHRVTRLRATPAHAELDPRETLVLLDPEVIVPADISALRSFVSAGGRLIAGGVQPGAWLTELLPGSPIWTARGAAGSTTLVPLAETSGVGTVSSDGAGAFSDAGATLPVVGDPGTSLVTVGNLGLGRIVLVADASPLQNHLLADADNAALGLALAGPPSKPVAFVEGVHGYGQRAGLAALPTRWKWTLIGLSVAALLMVAARIRRLGPIQPPAPPALPPRRAHVEAIAAALARTGRPAQAAAPVHRHARDLVLRRAGLPPDADAGDLAEAAARLGLAMHEVHALRSATLSDDDLLAAGSALAKLSRAGSGAPP